MLLADGSLLLPSFVRRLCNPFSVPVAGSFISRPPEASGSYRSLLLKGAFRFHFHFFVSKHSLQVQSNEPVTYRFAFERYK
ncbi:hypothetical protein I7I48_01964 [Histoplasma ohiense]|nr:hypothetical protein I7I48_01964 [Histoplasma ohiense (nom. inval.)]